MTNWDTFVGLPGAVTVNFEMLCRAIIRRHYGMYGTLFALANQPGVEFHLKLNSPCSLGEAGRWYGWQCRWYDIPRGKAITSTRRKKIEEALSKTEAELPGLTDWVLWTRYHLTEGDQKWFYSLPTTMHLQLWTSAEVEELLSGPAEILRGTFFGELILTPDLLRESHQNSVARVKQRWQPEVHQVIDAERKIRRALGEIEAWSHLKDLGRQLELDIAAVAADAATLPASLAGVANIFIEAARTLADSTVGIYAALEHGDYEILRQQMVNLPALDSELGVLLRGLRVARQATALTATNLLADMHGAHKALTALFTALSGRIIAVNAEAGCGKTELSAQLTAPSDARPAGVLLHGADLHANYTVNDVARNIVIHGMPVPSFEALLAAVDAAGQRAGRRLPIVIDGLNEAEDPRMWKSQLASLAVALPNYPFVVVVCTLRSPFAKEALPDGIDRIEIPGFEHDTVEAVGRYFRYYRINPTDADLPWRLLGHPLTLRMFCEVTNPSRTQTVGVEAMPGSLTAVFDRYLEQVAERIAELAPRTRRHYESDVRTALNKIGWALWDQKARSLDITWLRRLLDGDNRPWDESIVRALEHDGVLLRVPGDRPSAGHMMILYDALAGHLVADAILDEFGGRGFVDWLRSSDTTTALTEEDPGGHPLATDTFRALVGLVPRRMHRRQLWQLLDEQLRAEALYEAAWLDGAYLDHDTVSEITTLLVEEPSRRDLFDRIWTTRAARSHPLDARFLDTVLRSMAIAERDLRWSEWIRLNKDDIIEDLLNLENRWRTQQVQDPGDYMRAQWVMWTLTSTVRVLRDHATRALYHFGCAAPGALFGLTIDSLAVNDPYVAERMLAASYGVAMAMWADPRGENVRRELQRFANCLVDSMYAPGAQHPAWHALMKEYSEGIISLSCRVMTGCISTERFGFIQRFGDHLASPFPPASEIEESTMAEAKGAINRDFGNYTIGRLVPHRSNYDFKNPTYMEVRRQIEHRIVELGYSRAKFDSIDEGIGRGSSRAEEQRAPKTDRYGKKYAWIAYFEMYGVRQYDGTLPEWRCSERTSDADIDPSFPEAAKVWQPPLPDIFAGAPVRPRAWIAKGPTPDYDALLRRDEVDSQQGPWVLLNGNIQEEDANNIRQVSTFLRTLLVSRDRVAEVSAKFDALECPGIDTIPEAPQDCYTYAGEIPWSPRCASFLRRPEGTVKRNIQKAFSVYDGIRWTPGIPVEVPVYIYGWESYHSVLNQVSNITVPATALCERLNLWIRQGEWDFYDKGGGVATLYREFSPANTSDRCDLLYMREDLLARYLNQTRQALIWLVWGERDLEYETYEKLQDQIQDLWSKHKNLYRHRLWWTP